MFLKKIKPDFFLGIDYEFEKEYGFKYDGREDKKPGGILETGKIAGYKGGLGSAIGLIAVYDSRDIIINAQKGMLFEMSTYLFNNALGSSFNFFNVNTTFQKYLQLKKNHIPRRYRRIWPRLVDPGRPPSPEAPVMQQRRDVLDKLRRKRRKEGRE